MGLLTENKLKSVIELPIALPATKVRQGDWLIAASVKISGQQRLSIRHMTFQLSEANVDVGDIEPGNKVIPNLGLAYVVLRKDYVSGVPGGSGALDSLYLDDIGSTTTSTVSALYSEAGTYSILVANNMQAVSGVTIPTSTSIDFTLVLTGHIRLELIGA